MPIFGRKVERGQLPSVNLQIGWKSVTARIAYRVQFAAIVDEKLTTLATSGSGGTVEGSPHGSVSLLEGSTCREASSIRKPGSAKVSQGKCFPIYAIDQMHLSSLGSGLLFIHYELTCSKEGFNCGTLFVLGGKMEGGVVLLILGKD